MTTLPITPTPGLPPAVRVIGGVIDPPPLANEFGTFYPVTRVMSIIGFEEFPAPRMWSGGAPIRWLGSEVGYGPCSFNFTDIPWKVQVGQVIKVRQNFYSQHPTLGCQFDLIGSPIPQWIVNDVMTFGGLVRRRAVDGSEYEASAMTVTREGQPWMTYFAGYRLGFVAGESNWTAANLPKAPQLSTWPAFPTPSRNFELIKLPPHWVEGEAVEYVNNLDFPEAPGGYFFYATSRTDQELLDATANWIRTGLSFKSGGYVPVCRLFGSTRPGSASHFYSADAAECSTLRSNPIFSDEGTPFRANRLISTGSANLSGTPVCPVASIPLYRAYNTPAADSKFAPNHRYVTKRELIVRMASIGWVDEGAVMCVPE